MFILEKNIQNNDVYNVFEHNYSIAGVSQVLCHINHTLVAVTCILGGTIFSIDGLGE